MPISRSVAGQSLDAGYGRHAEIVRLADDPATAAKRRHGRVEQLRQLEDLRGRVQRAPAGHDHRRLGGGDSRTADSIASASGRWRGHELCRRRQLPGGQLLVHRHHVPRHREHRDPLAS